MKPFCVIGLLVFWATTLFAQKAIIKVAPLGVSRSELAKPVAVEVWNGKALFQQMPRAVLSAPPRCFGGSAHYTAFFCRMELHSVQTTGVWFKVHAGDYDSYSRKRW